MAKWRTNKKSSSNVLWSDTELQISVDAYLFMLQLEVAAVPFSATKQEKLLSSGPLSSRSAASVRYRLRNISYVLQERGVGSLKAYSSAPQVGKNVESRIQALLDKREGTLRSIRQMRSTSDTGSVDLGEVLTELNQLKDMISSIAQEPQVVAGIGHNNPPDDIDIESEELSDAVDAISCIEDSISRDVPNINIVESCANFLVKLGMKSAIWIGRRFTEFATAGAIAAGTGVGLSLFDLGRPIVETLQKVFAYVF